MTSPKSPSASEARYYCFYSKDQVDINHFGDADIFVLKEDHDRLTRKLAEARSALEKCAKPSTWHAPCIHCGEKMIEAGNYIARDAIERMDKDEHIREKALSFI